MEFMWVNQMERLENITNILQKEAANELFYKIIYVNKNNQIINVDTKCLSIINKSELLKSDILEIINKIEGEKEEKEEKEEKKYKFDELCYYFVEMEPDQIVSYSQSNTMQLKSNKLKIINKGKENIKNIKLEPSVFIFHNIHCLYLFFIEIEKQLPIVSVPIVTNQNNNSDINIKMVSILKQKNKFNKSQKRVSFITSLNNISIKSD